MADIPGFKNFRLLAQQPVAVGDLTFMKAVTGRGVPAKRYTLELTFENDHVVNVPLEARVYETILQELKTQPGVGVEQRMAARGAIASAGLEKEAPREQVLPLDATGAQVYEALLDVSKKEEAAATPLLEEADHDDGEDGID